MPLYIHRPVWKVLGCTAMSTPAKTAKLIVKPLWKSCTVKGCHSCSWPWKQLTFPSNLCSCELLCCSGFFLCFQMWKCFENGSLTPYSKDYADHITEIQNGWGWKSSLEVIQDNPPAQAGPHTTSCYFPLLALLTNQFLFLILVCLYCSSWNFWEAKFFNSGCFLSAEVFICIFI